MKRISSALLLLFLCLTMGAQNAKMPTIMVLPSDHWCSARYFTRAIENQGKKVIVNDYASAFRDDAELSTVVGQIGKLMGERGFPVKDYVQESRSILDRQVENEATVSSSGSLLMETPLDILRRRVKYDIELRIDWSVNREAKGKSVSFTLEALDTYTNKPVAVSTGTGKAKDDIVPRLLEKEIARHMEEFASQLTTYFNSLKEKGREITLIVQTWDSAEYNLENDFGDDMLLDVIQNWLEVHAVGGVFNLTDNTDTRALFEQVRIPLSNESGRAMDARLKFRK